MFSNTDVITMATIKSFTDLEQSKKLAEILPLESADMCYSNDGTAIKIDANPYLVRKKMWQDVEVIPCWSLAALLSIIPLPSLRKTFSGWRCDSYIKENAKYQLGNDEDNPIDACYEMILKLHEFKML